MILAAPKPAAQIEVTQEVHSVEGGQVIGVDLGEVRGDINIGDYTLRIGSTFDRRILQLHLETQARLMRRRKTRAKPDRKDKRL